MNKASIVRLSFFGILLSISLSSAFTGFSYYQGGFSVGRIVCDNDGSVCFGTSSQPANTNTCWELYLQFNSSTNAGKQMLSTLLAAKANGSTISLWYNAPGTIKSGNCIEWELGTVVRISID